MSRNDYGVPNLFQHQQQMLIVVILLMMEVLKEIMMEVLKENGISRMYMHQNLHLMDL